MSESSWIKAASTDDLGPGEGYETDVEINGEVIGLFCIDDKYYALGECPHEQGPLCQGIIEDNIVNCPWHSARFDITTGECLSGPTACRVIGNVSVDEESDNVKLHACNTYQVKVEGNDIYVKS